VSWPDTLGLLLLHNEPAGNTCVMMRMRMGEDEDEDEDKDEDEGCAMVKHR
jgi:hypothetical protein